MDRDGRELMLNSKGDERCLSPNSKSRKNKQKRGKKMESRLFCAFPHCFRPWNRVHSEFPSDFMILRLLYWERFKSDNSRFMFVTDQQNTSVNWSDLMIQVEVGIHFSSACRKCPHSWPLIAYLRLGMCIGEMKLVGFLHALAILWVISIFGSVQRCEKIAESWLLHFIYEVPKFISCFIELFAGRILCVLPEIISRQFLILRSYQARYAMCFGY